MSAIPEWKQKQIERQREYIRAVEHQRHQERVRECLKRWAEGGKHGH